MSPLAAAFEPSFLAEGARLVGWLAGTFVAGVALFPWTRRAFPRCGASLRVAASAALGVAMIGGASWLAARAGAPKSLAWSVGWLAWGAMAATGWAMAWRQPSRRERVDSTEAAPNASAAARSSSPRSAARRLFREAALGALPLLAVQAAWSILFLLLADQQTFEHLNLAFLQSILRWDAFPPLDPFLAGASMNYHYLPQWCWASILGPLGLDPGAHWGALAAANAAIATLVVHGAARRWAGRMTALAATVVAMAGGNGVFLLDWLGRLDAPLASFGSAREIAFQSTRFWFRLEAEYPFFSYWHGRFHGYLFSVSYALLAASLLLTRPRALELDRAHPNRALRRHLAHAWRGALAGAMFAVAVCCSALDAPAALLIAGFSVWLWPERWSGALVRVAACGVVAGALAWLFQSSLDLSGGRVVWLAASATAPKFLAIAFGFPAALAVIGFATAIIERWRWTAPASGAGDASRLVGRKNRSGAKLVALLALAAAILAPIPAAIAGVAPWSVLALLALLGALPSWSLWTRGAPERLRVASAFAMTATSLLLAAEAITILSPAETNNAERFNVYVKFGFLAWTFLCVAGAQAMGRPAGKRGARWFAARIFFPAIALSSAAGPAWLVARRVGEVVRDGGNLSFAAYPVPVGEAPGYAGAAAAIRERAGRGERAEIVAQAPAESWSDDPNMPARTGLLAPLTSRHQTIQRHGGADASREIERRERLLGAAYASPSLDEAAEALHLLGARFVVIGRVERRGYGASLDRFDGDARFERIYRDGECAAWELLGGAAGATPPPRPAAR